jgi:hypothetical protein
VLEFVGIEKPANTSRLVSVYMATEVTAENYADCQNDSSVVTYSCSLFHFIRRFFQKQVVQFLTI